MTSQGATFDEAAGSDASLTERLARFDRGSRARNPAWAAAYDELVVRLQAAEAGTDAPKVGDAFPTFPLPDDQCHLVSFDNLIASGALVISFNRGHWCSYCKLELRALQAILPDITGLGASVISVTPELPTLSSHCKAENGLSFPMLCDLDLGLALSLGLAISIGDRLVTLLEDDGVPLAKLHGGAGWLLPIPATFVVARNGTISARYVDPDFRRRMDTADILAALKAD
jgi:peroxiredoxin